MKRVIYFIFLSFYSFLICAQDYWKKMTNLEQFDVLDLAMDTSGNVYLTPLGQGSVYKGNIASNRFSLEKLPDFPNFDASIGDRIHPFIDYDQKLLLMVLRKGSFNVFRLEGEKYVLDTNQMSTIPFFAYIDPPIYRNKFDETGNLFINLLSGVYKYNKKWEYANITKSFPQSGKNLVVYEYYPYNDSINYALCSSEKYKFAVYQYNSQTSENEIIAETNLSVNFRKVVVLKNGTIFFPSSGGLYRYSREGKQVDLVIIDSLSNPNVLIQDFFLSVKGDALFCRFRDKFYVSYDEGDTWIRPVRFNSKIARGYVYKAFVLDTLRAVLAIEDSCGMAQAHYLHPTHEVWRNVESEINSLNLYELVSTESDHLFAKYNQCKYIHSRDDGAKWEDVLIDGRQIDFLVTHSDQLLGGWRKNSDSLFLSNDLGVSWRSILWGSGSIQDLFILNDDELAVVTKYFRSGQEYFGLFSSGDLGKSWSLRKENPVAEFRPENLMVDDSGNWLSFKSGAAPVFFSEDKGITWRSDSRFSNLIVHNILFHPELGVLIRGRMGGVFGLYRTSDFKVFSLLHANVGRFIITKDMKIVITTLSGEIKISSDLGNSWLDMLYNLNSKLIKGIPTYNSLIQAPNGHVYLSIGYDGVYKSSDSLVSLEYPISQTDPLLLFPNPVGCILNILLPDHVSNYPFILEIQNIYGHKIAKIDLTGRSHQFHVENLSSGIYNLSIFKEGILQYMTLFMKK